MIVRVYLSNIAPSWPIDRQMELMGQVPGWPEVPTYIDRLPPAKRKAHVAASLIKRAELLRVTARTEGVEVLIVASLPCLAWEQADFLQCIAIASRRGTTIIALDTGRRITPNASPSEIADANQEFLKRRRSKAGLGLAGYLVSAKRRAANAQAAAMQIKDRWVLSTKDYPTDLLLAEADICRNTANEYLGKRPDAQKKYRNGLAQAERNRKRRMSVELQEQAA